MHLVGYLNEDYHDARSLEHKELTFEMIFDGLCVVKTIYLTEGVSISASESAVPMMRFYSVSNSFYAAVSMDNNLEVLYSVLRSF